MKKRAVIFDFDYTLGDSTQGIVLSINYGLLQTGYAQKEVAKIRPTIGMSLKDTFIRLTKSESLPEAALFARYFKERADQIMTENTRLYDETPILLGRLKKAGYKTGIVTTKYHHRIDQILKKFELAHLVDVIVGGDEVKKEKPDPEGLLLALARLGVKPEEAWYIGDTLIDAKAAEGAGVEFIGVLTGTTTKAEFQQHKQVAILANVGEF